MADPRTTRTEADVDSFLAGVANETRRADAHELVELLTDVTGEPPAMWGPSIVGFGSCVNAAGASWMRIGFSPRAAKTSIYVLSKPARWDDQLERLGCHTMGKGCLYVNRLEDVDVAVLREMFEDGWAASRAEFPDTDA